VRQGSTIVRQRTAGMVMAAAAGLTVLALPSSASAHSDLVGTAPAAGTVAKDPVNEVSLEFASPILPELTAVVVTRGGSGVPVDDPVVDGSTVTASVDGAARPGEYTVAYRTVAADGHPITGSFSFEVAARPQGAAVARSRHDDGAAASTVRRRGGEGSAVADAARRRDPAGTAADPGSETAGAGTESSTGTVPSSKSESTGLATIGILGAGAAAVAAGARLLRRRSLT